MLRAKLTVLTTFFGAWMAPSVQAAVIQANADAFQTAPGAASVTLNFGAGPQVIPLEGATDFSLPKIPLTSAEVARLNSLAPNLGLVSYQLQWVNAHGSVVGPASQHAVGQQLLPVLNTTPNFDTVVQRVSNVTLTAAGQSVETQIRVLMLDLQSVAPVLIGGFHYETLVMLANGSPVFDPTDSAHPQFTGNIKFDATLANPNFALGTLDMGVTGPTPTSANLGANLPSGMEGLPVNFEIQFIPLDGGPAISPQSGETIFQNTGPSSFSQVPEPATGALLVIGAIAAIGFARRKTAC
jgi:hypothetical protein